MRIQYKNCILKFNHKIVYELNDVVVSKNMEFDDNNIWCDSKLKVTREFKSYEQSPAVTDIRFHIENIGNESVFLKECILVDMPDSNMLQLGNDNYLNFEFYRQGRHKNDLPGVCSIGKMDERFEDACGGMLESGTGVDSHDLGHKLVSDQMTIIRSLDDENVLFGFLTGCDQFFDTTLELTDDGKWEKLSCRTTFNINLFPEKKITTETLRIDLSKDIFSKIEKFSMCKAEKYHARKSQKAPAIYCTWYYYGLTVTYEDVAENLKEMQMKQLPFDVFQIDEGWEITLGEWEPNEKFPKPMKTIADEIKEAGYIPGIWTSPFVAKESCTVWKDHPEWILREKSGNPCIFPMNDTTYYVFDITNPSTYNYFYEMYHRLRYEWGYVYHKLDFTRAAVIYPDAHFFDDTITLVSAYYKAVCAIREGMGQDAYLLMCGGLYDPLIGIVDAQRVGADVLSMWSTNIDNGGKTAPYTIKQNLLRYYMNAWWDNDPDALMVRKNEVMERGLRLTYGLLNDEEVKTSTLNQFFGGGLVCSTEPLKTIDNERLYQIKHIIPTIPMKVTPRDIFCNNRYPSRVDIAFDELGSHSVGIINWDDNHTIPAEITIDEKLLGDFAKNVEYIVCEFYSGKYCSNVKYGETIRLGSIAPHGCAVFKIERFNVVKPYIVASDAHFSMGAEIDTLEIQKNCLIFKINYLFNDLSTYKVLLPSDYYFEDGSQVISISVNQKGTFSKIVPLIRKE